MRHSHEQVILSAIEEGRRETLADFQRGLAKAQARDWEAQKIRILEELGQHHSSGRIEGTSAAGSSNIGLGPGPAGQYSSRSFNSMHFDQQAQQQTGSAGSLGNARSAKYLAVIERLNLRRVESVPFALASAFGEAIRSTISAPTGSAENHTQDLYDCWRALSHIVGEGDATEGEFKGISLRERQYAPAYLEVEHGSDDAWLGREGRELRNTLVSGALSFLEQHFTTHVENRIASNPVKAQLGGRPTVIGKIVAFERVAFTDREGRWAPELELIQTSNGKVPAWATIFYLLCTGNAPAALDFAAENEEALRSIDGVGGSASSFISFFKAWLDSPDHVIPKAMRDRFLAEYNSRFRGTFSGDAVDGYKQSLFKLIGRVDVNKNFPTSVTKDTETWLWLQLNSVRESAEEDVSGMGLRDRLTLQDLGSRVVKFGDRHFDAKGSRPLHYFMLLLLCGQFERAIAFLYSKSQHQLDAINFAATLAYYGLLRVPPQSKISHIDILTATVDESTGQEVMMIDFAKLIQKYMRLFARTDVKGALQYAYLVCLNSDCRKPVGEEQTSRCHELIRSLVLSTRQYFDLLGDVRNDGTKTPGLIERSLSLIRLEDSKAFLTNIVGAAAMQSESENRTRDAILLYNIAEEYDRVLEVVNRQLGFSLVEAPTSSSVVSGEKPSGETSLASVEDMAQLARAILESYERQSHILRHVTPAKRETCRLLLTLKECFALFAKGEVEKTLNTIDALDLVPLHGDVVTITRKAESFKDVDDNIAKNLSEILLLVMNCVSKLYQSLKSSPYGDQNRQQVRSQQRSTLPFVLHCDDLLTFRVVFLSLSNSDSPNIVPRRAR